MASTVLFPPIVDGYIPAITSGMDIIVPFTFSKFNAAAADDLIAGGKEFCPDPLSIQVTINESVSGQSAVNTGYVYNSPEHANDFGTGNVRQNYKDPVSGATKNATVYASSGVILNIIPSKVSEGVYQIQLPQTLIANPTIGKKYKIQLRLSGKIYTGTEIIDESTVSINQADWLAQFASYFSEWSTICIMKYTSIPTIQFFSPMNYEIPTQIYNGSSISSHTYHYEDLLIYGQYRNEQDKNEYLISYRIQGYTKDGTSHDVFYCDSGVVNVNVNSIGSNEFKYEFAEDLKDETTYYFDFTYVTNNYFTDTIRVPIKVEKSDEKSPLKIVTVDDNISRLNSFVAKEEDEGRIGLYFTTVNDTAFSSDDLGTYRIKRYSSLDNFAKAEVIMEFTTPDNVVSSGWFGPYYDNTIESGVVYKYGIQKLVDKDNQYYSISESTNGLIRVFEYSYLLGYDKDVKEPRQLKLMFNQDMNSFAITVNDAQMTTLGGRYPYITRNGDTRYRQFPVNGLISFNMDENETFIKEKELYPTNIEGYYENYNLAHSINKYNDIVREKKFRDFVLNFLYDDRAKLFKSPTEGNIIVRLLNTSCSPEQSLDRMIYNFGSTAYEIADATLENYKKYKIWNPQIKVDMNHFIYED